MTNQNIYFLRIKELVFGEGFQQHEFHYFKVWS